MSAAGGSHLELEFLWPGSMTTFQPQVRENHLLVSKLDSHLLSCCVVYALMYDAMYVLISLIRTATCSGFVYSVMLLL